MPKLGMACLEIAQNCSQCAFFQKIVDNVQFSTKLFLNLELSVSEFQ